MVEQRKARRQDVFLSGRLTTDQRQIEVLTCDVSTGGCLLRAGIPLQVGSIVELDLCSETDRLKIPAEILRVEKDQNVYWAAVCFLKPLLDKQLEQVKDGGVPANVPDNESSQLQKRTGSNQTEKVPAELVERLARLRDQGVLTQEEFLLSLQAASSGQ